MCVCVFVGVLVWVCVWMLIETGISEAVYTVILFLAEGIEDNRVVVDKDRTNLVK